MFWQSSRLVQVVRAELPLSALVVPAALAASVGYVTERDSGSGAGGGTLHRPLVLAAGALGILLLLLNGGLAALYLRRRANRKGERWRLQRNGAAVIR